MELVLFPIAALLLLLSGVSTPAHAAEPQPSTAGLMRELFSNYDVATRDALWSSRKIPKKYAEYFSEGHRVTSVLFDSQFHENSYIKFFGVTPPIFRLVLGVRSNYEPTDIGDCLGVTRYEESDDCGQAHLTSFGFPRVSKRVPQGREYCTYWKSTLQALRPAKLGGWSDLAYTQHVQLAAPGAFTHKQYRTRFGFADGAYQAIGPPSHGPRIDLGWFQE